MGKKKRTKWEICPFCGSYWAKFVGKQTTYSQENIEYVYEYKCSTCVTTFEKIITVPAMKVYA
jgi:hypothetical protein